MTRPRRPRPPLDARQLDELALRYVGRFATSRRKLGDYLTRKVRERGWDGAGEPPVGAVVERLAGLGYVDDAAFALARGRTLGARGYGARRVAGALSAAGIGEEDSAPALDCARDQRAEAILRLARRRRIGPFADQPGDRPTRDKWLATLVRGGHDFDLARRVVEWPSGSEPSADDLNG
ncbi:regulatory protein RecX [Sphingomonas mesophila]|uniref:regulatory protein RecX n=1 Tax=Sphingomonas mesophila TaxID=2303576 RepID=UPI001F07CEC9|nr:RecX family transcriptional regulator [Sphingomonas mesophila]